MLALGFDIMITQLKRNLIMKISQIIFFITFAAVVIFINTSTYYVTVDDITAEHTTVFYTNTSKYILIVLYSVSATILYAQLSQMIAIKQFIMGIQDNRIYTKTVVNQFVNKLCLHQCSVFLAFTFPIVASLSDTSFWFSLFVPVALNAVNHIGIKQISEFFALEHKAFDKEVKFNFKKMQENISKTYKIESRFQKQTWNR